MRSSSTPTSGSPRRAAAEAVGGATLDSPRLPLELQRPKTDLLWMLPGLLLAAVLPWLLGAPVFVSWFVWAMIPVAMLANLPQWLVRLRLDEGGASQRTLFSRWHVPWHEVAAWNWTDPVKQTQFRGSTVLLRDRRDGAVHAVAPQLVRPGTLPQLDAVFRDRAGEPATGGDVLTMLEGPDRSRGGDGPSSGREAG